MEHALDRVTLAPVEWKLPGFGIDLNVRNYYAYNSPEADMLLVTGFGEKYIDEITRELGSKGVELAVMNLSYPVGVTLSFDVLEASVVNGIGSVVNAMNETAGRDKDHPVRLVGHSKGLGELVKFTEAKPELCEEITGAAPLGVNCKAAAFGSSVRERRHEIKRRLKRSGLFDEIEGDFDDLKRLAAEFSAGTDYLQAHDLASVVRGLHESGKLRHLVIGKEDRLCPPEECRNLINIDGLIVETDGGHDPLSSEQGLKQIELAISLLS